MVSGRGRKFQVPVAQQVLSSIIFSMPKKVKKKRKEKKKTSVRKEEGLIQKMIPIFVGSRLLDLKKFQASLPLPAHHHHINMCHICAQRFFPVASKTLKKVTLELGI